jgi:hypothetical protein
MSEQRLPRKVPAMRCATCGYRMMDGCSPNCAECGSQEPAIEPLKREAMRHQIRRFVISAAAGWLLAPLGAIIGHFSIAWDSMGMFIFGAILVMTIAPIVALGWAIVMACAWLENVLHLTWSIRDGEVGPWSRRSVRARVVVVLIIFQMTGAAAMWVLSVAMFPDYPSGWP